MSIQKGYTICFNSMTDAIDILERLVATLKQVQQLSEEEYISGATTISLSPDNLADPTE